jgi:hypothetical protein
MPLQIQAQLVLTIRRNVNRIDAFQRYGSRFPVRNELAAGVHVVKSCLPIRTFLLQMLLKFYQPWMNRRRRRPFSLHLSEQRMNPVC